MGVVIQAAQAVDLPPELQPFLADDDASDSPVNIYRDKSPARCLRSQSFWYLFFASAVCSGAGLTLLNNTAQMVWLYTGLSQSCQQLFCTREQKKGLPCMWAAAGFLIECVCIASACMHCRS
jgi:hypothetical protein